MVIDSRKVNIPLGRLNRVYSKLNTDLTIKEVQELAQLVKIKTSDLWEKIEKNQITFI